MLLRHGASVDNASNGGWPPLSLAVMRKDEAAVKRLLGAGANPAFRPPVGITALEQSRQDGTKGLERLMMNALARMPKGSEGQRGERMFMARKGEESFQFANADGRVLTIRRSSVPDDAFLVADSAQTGDEMMAVIVEGELVALENKTVSALGVELAKRADGIGREEGGMAPVLSARGVARRPG